MLRAEAKEYQACRKDRDMYVHIAADLLRGAVSGEPNFKRGGSMDTYWQKLRFLRTRKGLKAGLGKAVRVAASLRL